MNVLLDTNIVLDVLLARAPFVVHSSAIWAACDAGQLVGVLPASTLTNIFYIARRVTDVATAQIAVSLCLAAFVIAPVDRQTLEDATTLPGNDFEDNDSEGRGQHLPQLLAPGAVIHQEEQRAVHVGQLAELGAARLQLLMTRSHFLRRLRYRATAGGPPARRSSSDNRAHV